jgi:tripartite-type tricarboxylate transporter receptor subunit TctC
MAGNGGALAGRKVKDSPADGYTVLMNHSNIVMTELTGVADFGFEDFEVACTGAETCDVFIVKADSPFKTLKDLIEISKTGSEKVKIGGTTGSLTQLEAYSIISYGAVLNFVDVGSAAERLASLKGGHVQVIPNAYGTIKPYIESGEFRALGILSEQRNPLIPSIPTCKEQGYDIVVPMPYTFFFPKGTPKEITEKLSKAVEKIATTNKDYAQDIAKAFTQSPIYRNSEDALKHFRAIKARFTELRKLIK